jgi:hypothetical protein
MMNNIEELSLEEQLGEDDWALIIGKDGNLRGVFIPTGSDEDMVPESIVQIMAEYFGIDFHEDNEDDLPNTIH